MTTPRDPLGEEGKRIVAWLRVQGPSGATGLIDRAFVEWDSPWDVAVAVANAIEAGDHLAGAEGE